MRARIKVPLLFLGYAILLVGIAMAWISYSLRARPVPKDIAEGVDQVVQRHPNLRPMKDAAYEDDVLTMAEANEILRAAEHQPAE